jgi:hypothetical protein
MIVAAAGVVLLAASAVIALGRMFGDDRTHRRHHGYRRLDAW